MRQRRQDFTLQEWTDRQRALERGYDAKRRAKKRDDVPPVKIPVIRESRAEEALDLVVAATQALLCKHESPELGELLRERLAKIA
jgi:hypothetical protein